MQTFLVATIVVALAEIGDKTQLLSLVLAARYRKPWPVCLGILLATLANHALAASMGALVATWFAPQTLRWIIAASFFIVALWTLIPDKLDDEGEMLPRSGRSVLLATMLAFFLAEMGDKTQIATVVLAAQYQPMWQVIGGTTLGMLLANVPVVWFGARFSSRLPLRAARFTAAALFAGIGLWIIFR